MLKKSDGRFLIYSAGYPAPEFADEMKDANKVHYGRMEIIGTVGANASDVALAARLISKRLVHPEFMLQQKEAIPLRDIQKAYELAATPGTYRVSVDLQGV
jgi:L-iditol 2-dehydrogenase